MGKYGLIGERLSHSISVEIHKEIFSKTGIEGTYDLIEIEKDRFEEKIKKLLTSGYDGFNVTIPYKESIIPLLHEVSPQAKAIGAVNTVKIESGKLIGFNTDIDGFETMIDLGGLEVTPNTFALVIGTGGAAKTAAHWLGQKTGHVWFLSRDSRKAMKKLRTFQVLERKDESVIGMMNFIVNCSPCGMFPNVEESPIDTKLLEGASIAVDLVYNPVRTVFIQEMERKKCLTTSGINMLLAQALRAQEIWSGESIKKDIAEELIEYFHNEQTNPVLIGMPGSGKSTVGIYLAELMGREFIDLDQLIEAEHGPIKDIFSSLGEEAFRAIERETVKALRKRKNIVVATGGGTIIDHENVKDLKLNGTLIYLNRSLVEIEKTLKKEDRPLLKDKNDMGNLYEQRKKFYQEAADLSIGDFDNPRQEAIEIHKALRKKIF